MTDKLTDLLTKEKAFDMMSTAIEHHCTLDFAPTQRMMYNDIVKHYFNGDELLMKVEWLQYQTERYKLKNVK